MSWGGVGRWGWGGRRNALQEGEGAEPRKAAGWGGGQIGKNPANFNSPGLNQSYAAAERDSALVVGGPLATIFFFKSYSIILVSGVQRSD